MSYGRFDSEPADMETEQDALMGWNRTEGGATGVPWKEDSKMEALAREAVKVDAMVAMMRKLPRYP